MFIAPLTSYKDKFDNIPEQYIFKIIKKYEKRHPEKLGVVLLNNMIPFLPDVVTDIQFHQYEKKYKSLLEKQYKIIAKNIESINKIANKAYRDSLQDVRHNNPHKLLCNFQLLEEASKRYKRCQENIILRNSQNFNLKFIGLNPTNTQINFWN